MRVQRSNSYSLYNGGLAGSVWGFIITWLFVLCMIASMAEMASMAPTAGGQYHWVSEFAPRSIEKQLSYMVGWSSWLGWVSGKSFTQGLAYRIVAASHKPASSADASISLSPTLDPSFPRSLQRALYLTTIQVSRPAHNTLHIYCRVSSGSSTRMPTSAQTGRQVS